MIDLAFVERLIELLNRSNVETIEVSKGPWRTTVRVSKGGAAVNHGGPVTYHVAATPAAPGRTGGAGEAAEAVARAAPSQLLEIKSPMVGTFYARPEPGAAPYVRAGSRIKAGDTLCIIEAMKIMNPLDAEISGAIREICVEDAQPVEFGQVLFRVDPNG
jgi:acetyl-CoA carboxylase biotin carboxyl carrier protein